VLGDGSAAPGADLGVRGGVGLLGVELNCLGVGVTESTANCLIAGGTAHGLSRTQRTDEYRREVRSAASSIVRAARPFLDAASAFKNSIFWINDAVRVASGHDESYRACQTAMAELAEKIADFQLLVDIDVLSKSAFMVSVYAKMAYDEIDTITIESKIGSRANFTEARLDDELEQIRKHLKTLEEKVLPKFRECVHKYIPHAIVGAKRRRERILRPITASWRRLTQRCRKNPKPCPAKQKTPAETDPLVVRESATPSDDE
jgi:hypothetical protein